MHKYRVTVNIFNVSGYYTHEVTVEATDEKDAEKKAIEEIDKIKDYKYMLKSIIKIEMIEEEE